MLKVFIKKFSTLFLQVAILVVLLSIFTISVHAAGDTFCNPLNVDYRFSIAGTAPAYREAADPDIITYNGVYYLFASHSGGYWWSTDFKNWTFVTPTGINIENWAPAVIVIGSTMYYTASQNGDIYKTTDPKGGVWTDIGHPMDWGDPCLFVDDDGKVYCYNGCSANGSIDVVQLDPNNNLSLIGSVTHCFFADKNDHGFEVSGDNNTNYSTDTWIEGSWMTKYNGTYYLEYAVPGTGDRSYCDGVYKSSSPMGPFTFCTNSPVTARELGFVTGTGHGCVFKDFNGKYWKADTVTISVNNMFERRLAVFPASFDADGLMFSNTEFGDYPQYLPGQANNSVTNNLAGWNLLSYGKTALASSTNGTFAASNATDENIRTWWCAATGNSGEWLSVDLGKNCTINAVQPNFAEQDGTYASGRSTSFSYKYKIEYSTNGTSWSMLVDKSGNTQDLPHDYTELTSAVTARYLRITNLGTVPGYGKFAISDLRVFGNGGSALPGAVTSVNAIRNSDQRSATISWNSASGATGYVIRYGTAPNKLYNEYQILSGTSYTINSLNLGQDYYFAVDSFNDGGITYGTVTASASASKSFNQIEAESYNSQSGIQTETCSEGGQDVGFIDNGDYCVYNGFNFGAGATSFSARVASASAGGNIEIHLDSLTGTLVGTCAVAGTGGWQNWVTDTCTVSGATGTHNVYLKFTGGTGNLFNINWFRFNTLLGKTISLKNVSNNYYVSSENGTAPMNCNRTSASIWETFQVVDAGSGNIALKGYANNTPANEYVSSENGTAAMNCNRTAIGAWETFTWVVNSDGTVSLKGNNGQYVNGSSPMWCNGTTINDATKFQVTVY